jgi:hypothetical protein
MHWLWVLWFGYCWPSLKGNGPEAVIQTVVYFVLAVVFIPRFRRWLKGEFDRLHNRHGKQAELLGDLHRKLDHIIRHHPSIPDLPPKNPPVP